MRVVRGLHGFHLYATQHWLDYVLKAATDDCNSSSRSRFLVLSNKLATALQQPSGRSHEGDALELKDNDNRLDSLRGEYEALYGIASGLLKERAKRYTTAPAQTEENGMFRFLGALRALCAVRTNNMNPNRWN
jgi:hypothetical protein